MKTLAMTAPEMAEAYPPPQAIRAMAEGKAKLPEDPEKREQVTALIANYNRRKNASQEPLTPAEKKSLAQYQPPAKTVTSE